MKNPLLKCKYSRGLGDIVACVLHSKIIGWFTHIVTGKKEPCQACSQRIHALNILFPIELWKLFFKDVNQMIKSQADDLKKAGYTVHLSDSGDEITSYKREDIIDKTISINDTQEKSLITSNEMEIDGYLIKTEIYKK